MKKQLLTLTLLAACGQAMAQWTGMGTKADPYRIQNKEDLITLSEKAAEGETYEGKYFKVSDESTEFNFDHVTMDGTGSNFKPIQNFQGIFDGNRVVIKNMVIKGGDNVGLFGSISHATISNIIVESSCSFSGCVGVGAIAGTSADGSTITSCINFSKVTGGQSVGGIVGGGELLSISKCKNSGVVKSIKHPDLSIGIGDNVGGIIGNAVGPATWLEITDNINESDITGYGYSVGGICGAARQIKMTNNLNRRGTVQSQNTNQVGAVVGYVPIEGIRDFQSNYYYQNVVVKDGFSNVYQGRTPRGLKIMTTKTSSHFGDNEGVCLKQASFADAYIHGKTYYSGSYSSNENTAKDTGDKVYTVKMNGSKVALEEVPVDVIPAGQAVLVMSADDHTSLGCVIDETTGDFSSNILKGVDVATETSQFSGTVLALDGDNERGIVLSKFAGTLQAGQVFIVSDSETDEVVLVEGNRTSDVILFDDSKVESLCLGNWDTNHDGVLSKTEASAVTSLGTVFKQQNITTFGELKYFTGLTEIGERAFYECGNLTFLSIPESITSLAGWCLDATGLKTLHLPASVSNVNSHAIIENFDLEAITVDAANAAYQSIDGVLYTKDGTTLVAYPNKKGATYEVPDGVTTIGELAFYGTEVAEVTFPKTLTSIKSIAFQGCENLKKIELPKMVNAIDDWTFSYCSQLTDVYANMTAPSAIPNNVFTTNADAYATITLHVPADTKSLYESTEGWKKFKQIVEASGNIAFADAKVKEICITHWDTDGDGELSEAEATAVTTLGECFTGNEEITSFDELRYFTGLTTIDDYAFSECTALASVVIPSSVTTIGENAFALCYGMTAMTIPATVVTIKSDAFQGMISLTAFAMEDGNNNYCVENGILYDAEKTVLISCPAGKTGTIAVPATVTQIASTAFELCEGITSVNLSDGVSEIGEGAFLGSGITSINIPNTVTHIDNYAFTGCLSLTELQIGDHVQTIGDECFRYCPIKSVVIPASVSAIGEATFLGCTMLESAVINGSIKKMGTGFFGNCKKLTSVTLPATLEEIGDQAFAGCSALTTITLPEGLKKLCDEVFVECPLLNSVTLPSSLEEIGYFAFPGSMLGAWQPKYGNEGTVYRGVILTVGAGKGTVTAEVKTYGDVKLAIQIGSDDPQLFSRPEKGEVSVDYEVDKTTYVYIYAMTESSTGRALRASTEDAIPELYNLKVTRSSSTAIQQVESRQQPTVVYILSGRKVTSSQHLPKGIYIINNKKVVIK